jgi:hypothetical protein
MNEKETLKKEHKGASFPVPFGFALLLVVFLALAFFTFAAISLSTAKNDYSASKAMAEHKTEYAAACNTAERKIAALNGAVRSGRASAGKKTFRVKINSSQALEVSCAWDSSAEKYETTVWRTVSTKKWKSGTKLPVIK